MVSLATCITTYNCEAIIETVIDSCINQEVPFDQLIVVDDNSQDNTFQKVKEYKNRHNLKLDLYQFKKNNGGPAWSRNKGIDLCKSEYICFLDGDDIACSNRSKIIKNYLSKSNPDAIIHGIAICNINFKENLIKKIYKANTCKGNNLTPTYFFKKIDHLSPGSSIVLKTSSAKYIRFSEDKKIIAGEDKEILIRISLKGLIVNSLKDILVLYNVTDSKGLNVNLSDEHITSPKNAEKILNYYKLKYHKFLNRKFYSQMELMILVSKVRMHGFLNLPSELKNYNLNQKIKILVAFSLKVLSKFYYLIINKFILAEALKQKISARVKNLSIK